MAVADSTGIASLPNELLITVLSSFSTRDLLPLARTSHRFHDLILRIVHHRLIKATSLKDHKLILECFHPSAKLSTPYLFCDYLGTDGLDFNSEVEGNLYKDVEDTGRLGKLSGLYSHFRPMQPEGERKIWRPRRTGGFFSAPLNSLGEIEEDFVSTNIDLESYELFSQLCTITNLVKVGPKRDRFLSCVNIGDGLTRVFRDWLSERCEKESDNKESAEDFEKRLLWSDAGKNVGLRFRVLERESIQPPTLLRSDEDPPVSYTIQYEELVIRSTQLLLKVEESLTHEIENSGNAVVIGSWGA